jgi:hypothetical protein
MTDFLQANLEDRIWITAGRGPRPFAGSVGLSIFSRNWIIAQVAIPIQIHDLNTGKGFSDKLNSGTLKRRSDLFNGFEMGDDRALQGFESTHGRNRDPGPIRECVLFPSD